MAPKRKKSTAAHSAADPPVDIDAQPPQDSTPGLRRSGRQRRGNDNETMAGAKVSLRLQSQTQNMADHSNEEFPLLRPGVDIKQAMKDLHEIDERLKSNTKRQRRAIEDSHLAANASRSDEKAMLKGSKTSRKPPVNDKVKEEDDEGDPTFPSPQSLETAPMSEDEAKQVAECIQEDAAEAEPDGQNASFERGAMRPPPVNSDYLPLPWKGRLGYACLNTYLRDATPPVFSSRTCRIATILKNQFPLTDPSQPEHPKKNPRDEKQPRDVQAGQTYVEGLGLANARDIVKMLRWNDRFGIKFMRLSSEMFPFASHPVYGYALAPFASEVLAEAGRVAGELGHRLTTHPGQFTQLGSPRKEVVTAAVRDLEYHDEMLSLLKLPEQQDRDAVMILHMGGVFGDKAATLDRFRENYAKLPAGVKRRMVLENDDVSWSVHDLLPVCEELNIPMVLDFHHHNIVFDPDQLREGTKDIVDVIPRIRATWTRKGITPKMHYSESCHGAVTPRDRRKHSPRVKTLPPCPPDTDLMIEAKDKEQAVFELMRTFKLPGYEKIVDLVPYQRGDDDRVVKKPAKAKSAKKRGSKKAKGEAEEEEDEGIKKEDEEVSKVSVEDFGMGGPLGRVYWPEGMEEWLRPEKKPAKPKNTKIVDGEDEE